MKKHILSFALVATMVSSIAMSCSSEKKAGSSADSTIKDSTSVTTTTTTPADTMKKDTMTRDTTKKVPQ